MGEYWSLSLDDLAEAMYQIDSDVAGGHYVGFAGSRDDARQKLIDAFAQLIDKQIYRSGVYGSRIPDMED